MVVPKRAAFFVTISMQNLTREKRSRELDALFIHFHIFCRDVKYSRHSFRCQFRLGNNFTRIFRIFTMDYALIFFESVIQSTLRIRNINNNTHTQSKSKQQT